jgi:hypothetical protein
MTNPYNLDPKQIIAGKLPDMDPALRRRVLTIVTRQVDLIIAKTRAQERAWRRQQPGQDHISRGIAKSELRIERRLLAIMEGELKVRHGPKDWRQRQILQLAAQYRRLKTGQGISGTGH